MGASVVLGVDGGGTNTRAVLMQGDRVLARANGGSIKRLRVGAEQAEASLRGIMRELYAASGVSRIDAATAGVASASLPGIKEWIAEVFSECGVRRSEVVGDEVIALDGAFQGGAGILQIAGTGSNTIGRTATGGRESAGGYSSTLGDEGSGYWIGLHAIRQGLHAFDRGDACVILDRVGAAWGTKTLEELVNRGNEVPGPDFSQLAPLIAQAGEEGDTVAQWVLDRAADDIANFILLVRRKLRERRGLIEEVPVAYTGSVLEKIARVRARVTELLHEAAPGMEFRQEGVVAVEGALWRAQRLAEAE